MIDPRPFVQSAVNGEDQSDRRIEEGEVAVMLRTHPLHLAPSDPKKTVERKADSATTRQIGLEELVGIVAVLVPLDLFRPDSGGENGIGNILLHLARGDENLPWLHVRT